MATKYVYHYYATRQLASVKIEHLDGIVIRPSLLSGDWDEYQELKKAIDGHGDLTIKSLTLVGER